MVWLIGISIGLSLPWIIRRNALLNAFCFNGPSSGFALWGLISIITIPISTVAAFFAREML